MSGLVYVNDTDLSTLGVSITRAVSGFWGGPQIRQASTPLLDRIGHVSLTDSPPADPRLARVGGVQEAADTASLNALLDELKRLIYDGVVRIRPGDITDREWEAVATLSDPTPIGGWKTRVAHQIEIVFECQDPVAQALTPTVIDFSGGATQMPLGTAVSQPIIRIGDGDTDPVITLLDHRDQVLQTMSFTGTWGTGEWLEIDCENLTIIDQDGAAQDGALAIGDAFIDLNPFDGAPGTSGPFPKLQKTSGGGALAQAEYLKRWL